ncbi:MAG: ATP-binding cassette domain-containing protein [Actinomycetota bacterium]|nr:ATP-binding cassette domain-containing protein [Actinomycetota bacterium]
MADQPTGARAGSERQSTEASQSIAASQSTAPSHSSGASQSTAASLEFRNVSKRYPGQDERVLVDLSFEVPAGEICVLVGPSGCGKTTAMRMVNRMIDITEGDILLDGDSVRKRDPADLRRHIGYVIQQTGLFPHLSIGDNIATVPRLLGWDRKRIEARIEELLELISLPPETRARYPAEVSGGQRQRVGVARALAADPPLMLMDEPFGAIDPITRERLQNEFLRLQRDIRKTIVFVTHDIDEAIKMGDRIAILREGGVLVQYDTPDRILAQPADDFVARFVGLDRGLKRLALSTLSHLSLQEAQCLPDGTPARGSADRNRVVFVDDRGHPMGRLGVDGEPEPIGPTGGPDTSLRDALSLIMSDDNRPLVVVDADGVVAGLARVEVIAGALAIGNGSAKKSESGQ